MSSGHQDTARALVLLGSPDYDHQDLGEHFLLGNEAGRGELSHWGITSPPKEPKSLIGELSWLLALSGPTVFAVDQIDGLQPGDRGGDLLGPGPVSGQAQPQATAAARHGRGA